MRLWRELRLAGSFLTVLPVGPRRTPTAAELAGALACFPPVGFALGALLLGADLLLRPHFAAPLVDGLLVLLLVLLTGALHLDGVADVADGAPGESLSGCDLAVLCTPVAAIEALLGPVAALLPDGAVLTDVGGAKERVIEVAARAVRPGVAFVGAHPMFGGHGGYDGASAEKWKGGTVAVCTDGPPEAVERVAALHAALGARVERCSAAEHDAAVAMVSHLPYLVASALASAAREAGPLALKLAGPGLKDMTRLAAFPFDIQGEVARRNAHLPDAGRRLERHLANLLGAITASPEAARSALEAARKAREELF